MSISTIENMVHHITTNFHWANTRSLDSLLTVMAAEAEQEDLLNLGRKVYVDDYSALTIQKKTMRMLNLSQSDIIHARMRRDKRRKNISSETFPSISTFIGKVDKTNTI